MNDGLQVRGRRFALAALGGANADIFRTSTAGTGDTGSTRLSVTKAGAFRVTVILGGGAKLKVGVANAVTGGTQKLGTFNSNTALTANCAYTFVHGVTPGLFYDYQLDTDVAIDYLQIDEVSLGTA